MKKTKLRAITVTAIMGALGAVLMFFEFPLPFIPSFIKFDFSELPALITSFAFGPFWGVLVCLIKNLLHLPFGSTAGVGELSNFLLGSVFVFTAGMFYKYNKTRKTAIIGSAVGASLSALICLPVNYYIVYPIYTVLFMPMEAIISAYSAILPVVDNLWRALFIFNFPFTLVKGIVDTLICLLLYKKLSPILKGK